jgi:hypothetical protein
MTAWKKLYERVRALSEARMYRGKTDITLADLNRLLQGDEYRPGITGQPADPKGGMVKCQYEFNPKVWNGWVGKPGAALAIASTDSAKTVQTGNPQGGVVHKTNWGGRVGMTTAPIRPHHNDRLGSTMDVYDVLMVGDVLDEKNGILTQIAWSPAQGTAEERRSRLESLLGGGGPQPLRRRPQGDRPQANKDDEKRWRDQRAAASAGADAASAGSQLGQRGGSATNTDFRDMLAKHNAEYQPSADRSHGTENGPGLFPDLDPGPTTTKRMAGPNRVRAYPGGISTDRDKLRKFRK